MKDSYKTLINSGYTVITFRIQQKDGEYIWFESSIKSLPTNDQKDIQIYVVSRNITERKTAEENLEKANKLLHDLSTKDGLTGIWNRRSFDERLEREWKQAMTNLSPISLIMPDIDFFKAFNDFYGHQAGDDCLRKVATRIDEVVKKSGYLAFRYGGEEFSVILPNTYIDEAKQIAENIRKAIEQLKIEHEKSTTSNFVTVSLGTNTIIATEGVVMSQLIKDADKALYKAKESGRNNVKCYNELIH